LRIAVFRFCLTVASCTTIPTRIVRTPATTTNESSSDKEQAPNQTRSGGDHSTYRQDPVTTRRWSPKAVSPPRLPPRAGS
jgi:starvation-inducible outer membrane lipoprotein